MPMRERVSIVSCLSHSTDAEVVRRTVEAVQALGDYGAGLHRARCIAIKINAGVHRLTITDGKQTELTDPAVVEGVVRAVRDATDADIIIGDAATDGDTLGLYAKLGLPERLAKYPRTRLVDFHEGKRVDVAIPDMLAMFRTYTLPRLLAEADSFVSVAKMKAHQSLGCTLTIKNLFGWMPTDIYGAPRTYLHDRLIRLPHVLVDLAAWARPCLNVVDGIVAANKSEWNGEPMRPGVIVAGTNAIATDSVGARVMGFDPCGDYPNHPYHYRRNALVLAAERGLGPNRLDEIEVIGPSPESVGVPFHVEKYGENDRDAEVRHGAACVGHYRERQEALARQYRGRFLALFDGEVLWDGANMAEMQRKEQESGRDWRDAPQFVVRCLPPEAEIEHFARYEEEVARLPSVPILTG